MTKEEYLQIAKNKETSINEIRKEILDVTIKYREENRQFQNGQKVSFEFRNRNEFGFIKNCYVDYDGKIRYNLWRCKKDGTVSVQDWNLYQDVILTAVQP